MELMQRMARRQLVVVTGKGGVGKTVVSATLGRSLAAAGRRTLVVEVDPRENVHQMLGVPPSGGAIVQAESRLWVQNLKPRQVLDEIVRERLKLEMVARRVLDSPIYNHFAAGAPGPQGARDAGPCPAPAARPGRAGSAGLDTVVLDAPATGHGGEPACRTAARLRGDHQRSLRLHGLGARGARRRRGEVRHRGGHPGRGDAGRGGPGAAAGPARAGAARSRAAGGQRPVSSGAAIGGVKATTSWSRSGGAGGSSTSASWRGSRPAGKGRGSSCRSCPSIAGRPCSRRSAGASRSPPAGISENRGKGRPHGPDLRSLSAGHRRRLGGRRQDDPRRLDGRAFRPPGTRHPGDDLRSVPASQAIAGRGRRSEAPGGQGGLRRAGQPLRQPARRPPDLRPPDRALRSGRGVAPAGAGKSFLSAPLGHAGRRSGVYGRRAPVRGGGERAATSR